MQTILKLTKTQTLSILSANSLTILSPQERVKDFSRGLLFVNTNTNVAFVISCKCRDNKPETLATLIYKLFITSERERESFNSSNIAQESNTKVSNYISGLFSCNRIYALDKECNILSNVTFECVESIHGVDDKGLNFRKVFSLSKNSLLYDLTVIRGLGYDKPEVSCALQTAVKVALAKISYFRKVETALNKVCKTETAITEKSEREIKKAEKVQKAEKETAITEKAGKTA